MDGVLNGTLEKILLTKRKKEEVGKRKGERWVGGISQSCFTPPFLDTSEV